jgi:hypothetical protein
MREGIAGSMQQAAGRKRAGVWRRSVGGKKFLSSCLLAAACCLLLFGCGGTPNAANIALRKENQTLRNQRDDLTIQHNADLATILACEGKEGIPPAVTMDRLGKLFTAHDLSIDRLSGGYRAAGELFDSGVQVYVVPTDDQGEPIKAAGSFKAEAFDLQEPNHPLIGQWSFDLDQTRKLFYAHLSLYTYVLQLPWQTVPRHREVTIHVTFIDELTGRALIAQRVVSVNPPPSSTTAPTVAP